MSPEQSEASRLVDHRTDIWSLGVVLYEMMSGRLPFAGKDMHRQIIAIQEQAPPSLSRLNPTVPDRLEEIVMKALAKEPDERYQTAKDLLIDLRNLKRKLEVDAEIDRVMTPESRAATASVPPTSSGTTAVASAPHPVSSVEYIVNQVKLHKRAVIGILGVLLLVGAGSSFFYLTRTRGATLSDKDTILLTEFENKTGEEVFDGTLRQGLTVQLQQSPFLDIFPEERIRTTLQLMNRSPDERVTRVIGREICQRQGLKAYVAGCDREVGPNYSLTLEALNSQTGDSLAIVQVEAEGKDQVLKALSRAATELREKLGESLSSIQKFDAPLEVTTSSLDALKEYALGQNESSKGQYLKAIEFYRRALEKDPNFALAWLGLASEYGSTNRFKLAEENAVKAYALRGRVSEYERARITRTYYGGVTGELDKAIEAAEEHMRNYPRDPSGPLSLGGYYAATGQTEEALAFMQEGLRRDPNLARAQAEQARYLMRLNRYAEAGKVLQHALAQKMDSIFIRVQLYNLAFINGNAQAMQEQIAWASGKPDEYRTVYLPVATASFAGEWRKSQEHLRDAVELALRAEDKENAANYGAWQAARAAWLGQFAQAVRLTEAALGIERNREVLYLAAFALAMAGEAAKAQPLIQELEQQHPKDTRINQAYLPAIKAALALHKGDAQAALDLLEPARRFESADQFWRKTLRTMAYLKLGKGAEASAEARRVIEHRGEGPVSLLWPLAHLNLARASAMQGDTAQAKQMYEEFFKLWQNADADLPILIAAKREYGKLK